MQKHRADLLKGYLDRALARIAELEGEAGRWPVDTKGKRIYQAGADAAQTQHVRDGRRIKDLQAQLDSSRAEVGVVGLHKLMRDKEIGS